MIPGFADDLLCARDSALAFDQKGIGNKIA